MDRRYKRYDQLDKRTEDKLKDKVDPKIFSIEHRRQFKKYTEDDEYEYKYDEKYDLRPIMSEIDKEKKNYQRGNKSYDKIRDQGNLKTLINIVKRPRNFENLDNKIVEKIKSRDTKAVAANRNPEMNNNFDVKPLLIDPEKKLTRNVSIDTTIFDKIDRDNLKAVTIDDKRAKRNELVKKMDSKIKETLEDNSKKNKNTDKKDTPINNDPKSTVELDKKETKNLKEANKTDNSKETSPKITADTDKRKRTDQSPTKKKDTNLKPTEIDKKIKKNEQPVKKIDHKVKDRGDLKTKINDKSKGKNDSNLKMSNPDGDSGKVSNLPSEKIKLDIVMTLPNKENKLKRDTKGSPKTNLDSSNKTQTMDLKKCLLNRNSPSRLKGPVKKDDILNIDDKYVADHMKKHSSEGTHTNSTYNSDILTRKNDKESSRKKPIIKTIMTKNGSLKVYKAVTFEEKKPSPTPLEINIPIDEVKKPKIPKMVENSLKCKITVSKASVKEKFDVMKKIKKHDKKYKHMTSPEYSWRDSSPSTEVAKWAPSSITKQTQPYYEAWVDTTLAAVSKKSKKDKLLYEKHFKEYFQQALERPRTPELVYEQFSDAKYTGKIKIKQR